MAMVDSGFSNNLYVDFMVEKVNKNQIQLILNYGLILAFISLLLDMVGQNYGLWAYPIRLYWAFIPPLVPLICLLYL